MKFSIIKIFTLFSFLISSLHAEEIAEWRQMTFGTPSVRFSFQISTCVLSQPKATEKGLTWSGKIEPCYSLITDKEWYSGECSVETLKYAYTLTNKAKSAKITSKDWGWDGLNQVDVKSSPKYMFSVINDLKKLQISSYDGFITEEEFTTLANMLLNDVEAAKMKRTASTNMEQEPNSLRILLKSLASFQS